MKLVLTCGHSHSGYRLAHEALVTAGLAQARPSPGKSISAESLQEHLNSTALEASLPVAEDWREFAMDVFLGNQDHEQWGWADNRTLWLVDFWKAYCPQACFVLVYSPPEFAVGQMLMDSSVTPANTDDAIALWMADNDRMLRFYHRNQGRCLLVNATAVIHDPAQFIEKAAATFGLDLVTSSHPLDRSSVPAIASGLAKVLAEGYGEAMALYRELESSADFDATSVHASESEVRQAWQEYTALLTGLGQMAQKVCEQDGHCEMLGQKLAQAEREAEASIAKLQETLALVSATESNSAHLQQSMEAKIADQRVQLEWQVEQLGQAHSAVSACLAEIALLKPRNTQLSQENELLLLQLCQAQEEIETCFAERKGHAQTSLVLAQLRDQIAAQSATHDEQEARLEQISLKLAHEQHEQARLSEELRQHRGQLAEVHAAASAHQSELSQMRLANTDLSLENELLLLQLNQVQNELEQHLSQALEHRLMPWHEPIYQPAEIVYDLRREIDGENWHYPEHDGRWAGPNEVSSIKVPVLCAGEYEAQLEVVDAMDSGILLGMGIFLNGTPLEINIDLREFPTFVRTRFASQSIPEGAFWEFQFKFSGLLSPAQVGSDLEDHRKLAIRIRTLKLKIIE